MVEVSTYETMLENAKEVAASKAWEILAHKHFENPRDYYLMFVTIKRYDTEYKPYATLLFNNDAKGFAEGHYDFATYKSAYDDMMARE